MTNPIAKSVLYRAGFAQVIAVGETDAEAEKLYKQHIDYFYNRCLHVYPGFGEAPGYRTIKTLKRGAIPQLTPKGVKTLSQLSWKELLDQRYVICGSPETVRQQCEEMIQELDRAMGEFFAMERQLEQQLTQTSAKTLQASAKAMDHFMGLIFK